jgi:cytoskeleton protein RodZ
MNQRDHLPAAGTPTVPPSVENATGMTLGELLRQARERRGLTLEEVARRTRIPKRHLEQLELNSLVGIPPGMYQRAEVRTYADAVGLDPQLALVALGRAQAASQPKADARPPQRVPARARQSRRRIRLALVAIVAVALPAAAATVLWRWQAARPADVQPPAVEDKAVPTSLRPDSLADPQTGAGPDGAAPTPSPAESVDVPKVFEYPDLRVITEPPGARVTVDGVGWGPSPMTIRALPSGTRLVRVTLDGYAAEERHVAVSANEPRTTVRITLKPLR